MADNNFLDRVYVASPCNADWADMQGDERVRMCSLCSKNVYNISDMPKKQAENFLASKGASVCMRFYRRSDGTIITDDCPVRLRKIRSTILFLAGAAASVLCFVISLPFMQAKNFSGQSASRQVGIAQEELSCKAFSGGGTPSIAPQCRSNYFNRFPVAGRVSFVDATESGEQTSFVSSHGLASDKVCESGGEQRDAEARFKDYIQCFRNLFR